MFSPILDVILLSSVPIILALLEFGVALALATPTPLEPVSAVSVAAEFATSIPVNIDIPTAASPASDSSGNVASSSAPSVGGLSSNSSSTIPAATSVPPTNPVVNSPPQVHIVTPTYTRSSAEIFLDNFYSIPSNRGDIPNAYLQPILDEIDRQANEFCRQAGHDPEHFFADPTTEGLPAVLYADGRPPSTPSSSSSLRIPEVGFPSVEIPPQPEVPAQPEGWVQSPEVTAAIADLNAIIDQMPKLQDISELPATILTGPRPLTYNAHCIEERMFKIMLDDIANAPPRPPAPPVDYYEYYPIFLFCVLFIAIGVFSRLVAREQDHARTDTATSYFFQKEDIKDIRNFTEQANHFIATGKQSPNLPGINIPVDITVEEMKEDIWYAEKYANLLESLDSYGYIPEPFRTHWIILDNIFLDSVYILLAPVGTVLGLWFSNVFIPMLMGILFCVEMVLNFCVYLAGFKIVFISSIILLFFTILYNIVYYALFCYAMVSSFPFYGA